MVLTAAGLQHILMKWAIMIHFPTIGWLWMTPFQFFVGWGLMFLPGAVTAHKLPPRDAPISRAFSLMVWLGPAIAGLVPAFVLA